MSTSNEEISADESTRTTNVAADLLDDDAATSGVALSPPVGFPPSSPPDRESSSDAALPPPVGFTPSSPPTTTTTITTTEGESSSSASLIVSEAASLTTLSNTQSPSTVDASFSELLDDDEESSFAAGAANSKPSIATVTAIVDEVLRQKEIAGREGGGTTADIAIIASEEVEKYYEANDIEGVVGDYKGPAARSHPWNQKHVDETQAFFARDGESGNAATSTSLKFQAADGTRGEDEMERGLRRAPRDFDPNTAPDFSDICEELGIDASSHPHLRSPYSRSGFRYFHPEAMLRSPKCHYCAFVLCFMGIAIVTTSMVMKGFEHIQKRQQELNPKWIKEEEVNQDKEWWSEQNADEDALSADISDKDAESEEETYYEGHHKPLPPEELEQLYYSVSDAYLPIWFDRGTGWNGRSFEEAIEFCQGHDDFLPCPYEVYCPGGAGKLIFGERFEDDGESWAPIRDDWNEWVQVGDGRNQCETYGGMYKRKPLWGTTGNRTHADRYNEELTSHIMCCLEQPLGDELFKTQDVPTPHGGNDPIPPPLHSKDMSNTTETPSVYEAQLTPFEEDIRETYNPFWFNTNDGWTGSTYEDGREFCESISNGPAPGTTFHLCPIKAHCPNGFNVSEPLVYQMKPFDEGQQWSPISNVKNGWVMVGKVNDEKPDTCHSYMEIHHKEPDWGLDGTQPELKRHILCCEIDSGDASITLASQGIPIVQIAPSDPTDEATTPLSSSEQGLLEEDGTHTGAGNSSPHVGKQHVDDAVIAMKRALDPVWFNSEEGWTGGSHDDALEFCDTMDRELCPYAAYCPHGPTFPVLEGRGQSDIGETSSQWAPTINGNNQWVLIGTLEGNESTQCMDYIILNGGESPSWGLDGSKMETKRHILCCDKSSFIPASEVQQQQQQQQSQGSTSIPTVIPTFSPTLSPITTPSLSEAKSQSPTSETTEESIPETDPAMQTGTWFNIEDGWNAGSHDDAAHFCSLKEVNAKPMELCPFGAYCPSGPSRPHADGQGEIGANEESEQWAPTSVDDEWVMVGIHGHNKAVQCLTHEQLYGADKEVDLVPDKKHYIMCCEAV